MPSINKKCAICDVVFPHTTDIHEIVSHSATCVHSFCEKNSLSYCMCLSCSGHQKAEKRSRIHTQDETKKQFRHDNNLFTQALMAVSQYLSRKALLKVSVLSRTAFMVTKPTLESKLWFLLRENYSHYNPVSVITSNMRLLRTLPHTAKHVWFRAEDYFNLPIDSLPAVVTKISLPKNYNQTISKWPHSLIDLDYCDATPETLALLPSTVEYLEIGNNQLNCIPDYVVRPIHKLPHSLRHLKVKFNCLFHFSSFPPNLESYTSLCNAFEPPLPELPNSLKSLQPGLSYDHLVALIPPQIETLKFGTDYDQPVSSLPSSLKILEVGDYFRQKLPPLPANLMELKLGRDFSQLDIELPPTLQSLILYQTVSTIPPNLAKLKLRGAHNPPIHFLPASLRSLHVASEHQLPDSLPNLTSLHLDTNIEITLPLSLRELTFGHCFTKALSWPLPPCITKLEFGSQYNRPIQELPASLVSLTFGSAFNSAGPDIFPANLTKLEFGSRFNQAIQSLPTSLKYLVLGYYFNSILPQLPSTLKYLTIGGSFQQVLPLPLPPSLVSLTLGERFNHPIDLPASLQHLQLGDLFNSPLSQPLPSSIKWLTFGNAFNQVFNMLPSSLEKLIIGDAFSIRLPALPSSLKFLHLGKSYKQCEYLSIPPSLERLEIFGGTIPHIPATLQSIKLTLQNHQTLPLNGLQVDVVVTK